jgi:hypothetical protein
MIPQKNDSESSATLGLPQPLVPAFQAGFFIRSDPQGVALGYVVPAFQAEEWMFLIPLCCAIPKTPLHTPEY